MKPLLLFLSFLFGDTMTINDVKNIKIKDMAVINLTSEEFAVRIEEMLDLASKGDNVLIHHLYYYS